MRHDFSSMVKTALAKRVAYKCSSPDCGALTVGPGTAPDATASVGVAAHIHAASPGGPRYKPSLSASECSDISNGIWLCQTHSRQIDVDEDRYPADLLRRWKANAEEDARELLGRPSAGTMLRASNSTVEALLAAFRRRVDDDAKLSALVEDLQHWHNSVDPEVLGLDEKLKRGGRTDLVRRAAAAKERFAMRVAQYQFSQAAQDLFAFLLADVHDRFQTYVVPELGASRPTAEVDQLVREKIVDPIIGDLGANDLKLSAQHIRGMVYFLTGNCHIRWDGKC